MNTPSGAATLPRGAGEVSLFALPPSDLLHEDPTDGGEGLRVPSEQQDVRLRKGEANLARASVVNVSQLGTVDRSRLTERVGTLGPARLRETLSGLGLVLGLVAEPE